VKVKFLQWLDEIELPVVRKQAALVRNLGLGRYVLATNWLGNGWIYAIVAPLLVAFYGQRGIRVLASALVSVGLAHALYPLVKRALARARPIDIDRTLGMDTIPLDKYSCPSGHSMTATAVFVPVGFGIPSLIPVLFITWLTLSWGRLAIGHHYPSDVALGAVLGALSAVLTVRVFDVAHSGVVHSLLAFLGIA